MSSKGTSNMSWRTKASRSSGERVSKTIMSAMPTESAIRTSRSGSTRAAAVTTGSGSRTAPSCSGSGSSRREVRERSMSRHVRPTTVVSQAPRFFTSLTSVRLSLNHASWTASSASASEPSIR